MPDRKVHPLKTESEYYQAVLNGQKKFEIRVNDRDFAIGDLVYLEEMLNGEYTGRQLGPLEIKYIFEGERFGLAEGSCIFNW